MDLFGSNEGRISFRAVFVWGMETHTPTAEQIRELHTVNWSNYAKGQNVNLQRVKAKFLSYNSVTNTVYLEEL